MTRCVDLGHGNQEAFLSIAHPSALWGQHSLAQAPSWVSCETNPDFERMVAEHFGCSAGRPRDVFDTHFSKYGVPGVGPWNAPVQAALLYTGRVNWANNLGGGQVGACGTGTAASATSVTTQLDSCSQRLRGLPLPGLGLDEPRRCCSATSSRTPPLLALRSSTSIAGTRSRRRAGRGDDARLGLFFAMMVG